MDNYYTKSEVDNKIVESSPFKTTTIQKDCTVSIHTGGDDNYTPYRSKWYNEYASLNPILMKIKFKTLTVRYASNGGDCCRVTLPGNHYEEFNNLHEGSSVDISDSDLPTVAISSDDTVIFGVSYFDSRSSSNQYKPAQIIVTVDLSITYIQ